MMEEEKANSSISDSRAAAASSPDVPPGFQPKACTTTAAAAGLSRNQNPFCDANVFHAKIGTSDSCSKVKEELPRHSPRKRSQPQFYVPTAPAAQKPALGLRRRGRPRKSEAKSRLAHLEKENGNTNQISSTSSRRLQDENGVLLTEVPGHETPQNFVCNNLVSEGIDPKILQHVANALQCMAESHNTLDDANVISRSSDINKDLRSSSSQMIKEENANSSFSDIRAAAASPCSSPNVPPGFPPEACTTPAARLSRNQNPIYDDNVLHGKNGTSDSEETQRRTYREKLRPRFYVPPTSQKQATGLRRRGRPRKAELMSRLETERGNTNQIPSTPSRRLQDEISDFISSHEITKNQSSLRVNDQVSEHGSQIHTSPSPHHLVGLKLMRKADDISVDKIRPREDQGSSFNAEDIEETLIDVSVTQVPGPVSYEKPWNFGFNNQVSEGIDPKILQHVTDYMAENHTALDDAKVISRSSEINKNLVHTLKAINIKHGDITQNCSMKSDCMRTLVLLGICKVVQDLQKKHLKDLDISSLDSYYTAVRDAENVKVNVQWLRSRLDEIKDAFKISDEAKCFLNERDRRLRYIDGKKKELMLRKDDLERLKYEVQDIEKHLTREIVMVDELDKKFGNQMSKISQFQHANLMDGLI